MRERGVTMSPETAQGDRSKLAAPAETHQSLMKEGW